MIFEIRYTKLAHQQLRELRALDRSSIIKQIDTVLSKSPTFTSKARVKHLRQLAPTEYRLKVGDYRVFYNVADDVVQIIQILCKADSFQYYEEFSNDAPDSDESDDAHR